jgi:hypothetical protein
MLPSISSVVMLNLKSRPLGVGTFFLRCVFARIPSPREATGHAQDDLGIYLTEQTALRDMPRWLRPYSLPTCTETVLLKAMLRAVPGPEGRAGLQLRSPKATEERSDLAFGCSNRVMVMQQS